MANEINFTGSLSIYKATSMTSAIGRAVSGLLFSMTGNVVIENVLSVGTSATLIPLGGITTPHWAFFRNMDVTNYLNIRNGSGGANLPKLFPGEVAFIPLDDTSVPYAIANTAVCLLEYMIASL